MKLYERINRRCVMEIGRDFYDATWHDIAAVQRIVDDEWNRALENKQTTLEDA